MNVTKKNTNAAFSAECKIIETNPSSFAILYMCCIFNVIKVSIIMRGILHGADESSAY